MPHLDYNDHDLSMRFPSLCAPQDSDDNNEASWDSWDKIYQRGLEIIDDINTTMRTTGRRRCEQQPSTNHNHNHNHDNHNHNHNHTAAQHHHTAAQHHISVSRVTHPNLCIAWLILELTAWAIWSLFSNTWCN